MFLLLKQFKYINENVSDKFHDSQLLYNIKYHNYKYGQNINKK